MIAKISANPPRRISLRTAVLYYKIVTTTLLTYDESAQDAREYWQVISPHRLLRILRGVPTKLPTLDLRSAARLASSKVRPAQVQHFLEMTLATVGSRREERRPEHLVLPPKSAKRLGTASFGFWLESTTPFSFEDATGRMFSFRLTRSKDAR